mmetsp:Transcript_127796/g.367907  ORF Transcript_127796/g.367907 Transcript_127796/m.367907 type:complete len:365 (-) Transcript_127796:1221-2315(-)
MPRADLHEHPAVVPQDADGGDAQQALDLAVPIEDQGAKAVLHLLGQLLQLPGLKPPPSDEVLQRQQARLAHRQTHSPGQVRHQELRPIERRCVDVVEGPVVAARHVVEESVVQPAVLLESPQGMRDLLDDVEQLLRPQHEDFGHPDGLRGAHERPLEPQRALRQPRPLAQDAHFLLLLPGAGHGRQGRVPQAPVGDDERGIGLHAALEDAVAWGHHLELQRGTGTEDLGEARHGREHAAEEGVPVQVRLAGLHVQGCAQAHGKDGEQRDIGGDEWLPDPHALAGLALDSHHEVAPDVLLPQVAVQEIELRRALLTHHAELRRLGGQHGDQGAEEHEAQQEAKHVEQALRGVEGHHLHRARRHLS